MIDYGAAPEPDEIEVTVFGPGFGEAIAVHLGEGSWILIDSCIDPDTKSPASGAYLEQIGVHVDQVRIILATHWDDDHVRGISQLSVNHPNADFMISGVFDHDDAAGFLSAYSGASSSGLSRGTKELFSVLESREYVIPLQQRSLVFKEKISGHEVLVTALSPIPKTFARFLSSIAQHLPKINQPIKHVPQIRPNFGSVVLHIDVGDDSILLGADMEDDDTFGWTAMIADNWTSTLEKAAVYKVAHHGAKSGDCTGVWTTLLRKDPIACLTPFIFAKHRLPEDTDKARIKNNSSSAYISSGASQRPEMDSRQLKRLADICNNLSLVNPKFGAVRLRTKKGTSQWSAELFGAAQAL